MRTFLKTFSLRSNIIFCPIYAVINPCIYLIKCPTAAMDIYKILSFVRRDILSCMFEFLVIKHSSVILWIITGRKLIAIVVRIINKNANDKSLVRVGRIAGLVSLIIAILIAPQLKSLGQVFQYIQEYTGVVSPGILAVFLMGLFYKKASNNGAIWGVLLSIPIAMYFKVGPNGWSSLPIFNHEVPFMNQMLITCLITMLIIFFVSKLEGDKDNPKGIVLTNKLFKTSPVFNISAFAVCIITAFLYAFFW